MTLQNLGERLSTLAYGDHVCPIYETAAEQLGIAVEAIRLRLARGDRCVYVAEGLTVAPVVEAFAGTGIDVQREIERGALLLLTERDADLHSGPFDPREMIEYLRRTQAEALAAGFSGLLYIGERTWAAGEQADGSRLIEYEALINEFQEDSRSLILCQYFRPRFDDALIHDVLLTHPLVVLGDFVCPNPYYEPPDLVLRSAAMAAADFKRRRVNWWITGLRKEMTASRERERCAQVICDREERIRLLLDSTAEAIYGVDLEGRCTFANKACARLLGIADASALEGKHMHRLMHHSREDGTPFPESECGLYLSYATGIGKHVDDETFFKADGSTFHAEYFSFPIRQRDELIGAVVTFLDISERRALEEKLRQSHKLEAIGQLAGGVAHDFNNLLTVITGYAGLLLESLEPGDPRQELVEEIQKAGDRSTVLTRQLLAFSRKQVLAPEPLDVNAAVIESESMLRHTVGDGVELTTDLEPQLPTIMADPGQLQQVLLNLAANARDAMPGGGRLSIETRRTKLAAGDARAGVRPGPYVTLVVRDSGTGMTDDVKRHIFEPFFTTKGVAKGTGLGLAVVHGIVAQSEGHVEVESREGVGTTFRIYLPATDQAPRSEALVPVAAGAEAALFIDDETGVEARAVPVM